MLLLVPLSLDVLGPALGIALAGAPVPAQPDSAYHRVVSAALQRAERELVEGTDLWVDHSSWENAWEVETENYVVRTTRSRYFAASVAEGLEVMLGHFQRVLDTDYVPAEPFRILIFPDLAQYNAFGNANGAEHSSAFGVFYTTQDPTRPVATYLPPNPNETLLRMWITHGAVHQFVDRAFQVEPPTGISEGLASYFSLYWDRVYASDLHRRLKDGPTYVPLATLLEDPLSSYVNDHPDDRFWELGLFFTYLLHYRDRLNYGEETMMAPPGQEEPEYSFATYLRTVLRGGSPSSTSFYRLLSRSLDRIEEDFRTFDFPR